MKDKQIAKFKMFTNVVGVMNTNKNIFSNIVELNKSHEILKVNVTKIGKLAKEQGKNLNPISVKKLNIREGLIKNVIPVTNILLAYAYDIKDHSYAKKIDVSKNKLLKSKDEVVIEKCNNSLKISRKLFANVTNESIKNNQVNIINYGLNGKMIDELENSYSAFITILKEQKDAITYRVQCTKQIGNLITETDKLIKNKIDRLITIVEKSNSPVYEEYKKSRILELEEKVVTKKEVETTP